MIEIREAQTSYRWYGQENNENKAGMVLVLEQNTRTTNLGI